MKTKQKYKLLGTLGGLALGALAAPKVVGLVKADHHFSDDKVRIVGGIALAGLGYWLASEYA